MAGKSHVKRPGLLAFIVVIALVIATVAISNHALGVRNLGLLEDTRSQLQIPDSWTLAEEEVSPPGWMGGTTCNFGATQCPQIQLTFNLPNPVEDASELKNLLPEADWEEGDSSCTPRAGLSSSSMGTCSVDTRFNGTEVHVAAGGAVNDGEVTDPWATVRIHNL